MFAEYTWQMFKYGICLERKNCFIFNKFLTSKPTHFHGFNFKTKKNLFNNFYVNKSFMDACVKFQKFWMKRFL